MTELDELIQQLRAVIRSGQDGNGTRASMLAGLLSTGPARVTSKPGNSVYQQAGYLSGHLIRWLVERGHAPDDPVRLVAAGYAASLADPAGQRALAKPDMPMTAHSYAAVRCEQQSGRPLAEAEERLLFDWLLEQTRTPATASLDAKFQRLRSRRHARLGFGEAD